MEFPSSVPICGSLAVQTLKLVYLLLWLPMCFSDKWPTSSVTPTRGHYPPYFCKVTNAVFDSKDRVFWYKQDSDSRYTFDNACGPSADMWAVTPDKVSNSMDCSETYDEGYVFTIYFYYTGSNYFHLHYDMMIPLFSLLRNQDQHKKIVLMPSVESSRLKAIYWDTAAFKDPSKYWYQMLLVMTSTHSLLPLDQSLERDRGTICFKSLYFGTPDFALDDKELVVSYITYIKSQLDIKHERLTNRKVGIIKRSTRRKILNEGELVNAVSAFADVELVEFSGLSFEQQVRKVQEYAVLVGMNGAGLMNALFLSPGAVAVQLVPYDAELNFKEFEKLLRNRGPYLEWHNEHADLTLERPNDPFHGQSDTTVKVEEFVELIKKSIQLVNSDEHVEKSEL